MANIQTGVFFDDIPAQFTLPMVSGELIIWNAAKGTFENSGASSVTITSPSLNVGAFGFESGGVILAGATVNAVFKVSEIGGANVYESIIHKHSTTLPPATLSARSNSDTSAHAAVTVGQSLYAHDAAGWTGAAYNKFGGWRFEAAPAPNTISAVSSPGRFVVATTPNAAVAPVDALLVMSDGRVDALLGLLQKGKNVPYILAQSAVPSGIAPTGTVAANGALTLGTALPTTYGGGIYLYLPAGAAYAGSVAGSYWCVMASTTDGVIYDTRLSGMPTVPAAPVAIVAAGPGAYVGATVEISLLSVTLPGGYLGANGGLRFNYLFTYNNSVGTKTTRAKLAATTLRSQPLTTTVSYVDQFTARNRGVANRQVTSASGGQGSAFGAVGGINTYTAIDTSADQVISFTGQLAVATDVCVFEFTVIEVLPGA